MTCRPLVYQKYVNICTGFMLLDLKFKTIVLNFHEQSSLFFLMFGHLLCLKLYSWLCKLAL